MTRVEAPQGWVKKVDRAREGRVWVGYFHVWETTPGGKRVRRKKEKTIAPASKPKHEALKMLADYIAEHTGKLAKQGESISTFEQLWRAFCAVKAGQWSRKTKENLEYLFAKHVLPTVGSQRMRDVTLTSLQLLVNKLAQDGYSKSVVAQIRTYVKACFGYAVDEDLIPKSPACKLVMPNIRRKTCERFLSVEEFRALLSHAAPREQLVLRILGVCGLRRQPAQDRIGETKTDESDNFVPVPPDLEREIEAWIAGHPNRHDPRAFLFPNSSGAPFSVGNYLKRHLKPLAEKAGIRHLTHQAFQRSHRRN